MKKLLYLTNFEFRRIAGKLAIIILSMVIIETVMFYITISNIVNQYQRFEALITRAGYPIMFYCFLLSVLVLVAFSFNQNFSSGKSIYTLLMLPSKRSYIFWSKFLSAIACTFTLTAAQIINIFITYDVYEAYLKEIPKMYNSMNIKEIPMVHNGLFLAFIRSDFLRVIFPIDLLSFIVSLISLLALSVLPIFVFVHIKSRNIKALIGGAAVLAGTIIYLFPLYRNTTLNTVVASVIMLCCIIFMIMSCLSRIENSEMLEEI